MSGPDATTRVWREAAAIVGRYPAATIIPGAVLGAIAEAAHYFAEERIIIGNVLTYATATLAYYLYLAYAEEIVIEYGHETERLTPRNVLRELRDALSYVWRTLAAGLMTLVTTVVAAGLLVIPRAWLYTRWSLAILAIRHESLGPAAALKRSNALVRSRFWFVFATATLAFVMEETLVHLGPIGRLRHIASLRTPRTNILVPRPSSKGDSPNFAQSNLQRRWSTCVWSDERLPML